MEKLLVNEIARATRGEIIFGDGTEFVREVSIDSRTCEEGSVFFPMIGEVHDGHKFIKSAYEQGCRVFVVNKTYASDSDNCLEALKGASVIAVDDTLIALQELSRWYLGVLDVRVVAVTGSVGKTTTRDMIYAGLASQFKVGRSKKNYNSEFGLPLSILSFDKGADFVVLEMGMDGFGQIHKLVDIARPEIAAITNIGISHIERLGSQEGILKAKMEITDFFTEENTLVINSEDELLEKAVADAKYKVIKAGGSKSGDLVYKNVKDLGAAGIEFTLDDKNVKLDIPGGHNAINAAIAVAVCKAAGVDENKAISAIEHMEITGNRLRVIEAGDYKIIDDSYNAAPLSMKSAVATLAQTSGKRKVAFLAGMNELGSEEISGHKEVGACCADLKIDLLVTVGEKGKLIAEGAREKLNGETSEKMTLLHFDTKEELYPELDKILEPGDVILLKASRTYEMEKIGEVILKGISE